MNKITFLFYVFVTISIISCSNNSSSEEKFYSQEKASYIPIDKKIGTTYMPTGFYFLADGKMDGVRMKLEHSDQFYIVNKKPFASVANIKKTDLTTTKLEQDDYTQLCLTFNNKGTKDLAEGTGNILHPKMAVVIAGKLLYVVNNTAKIKTGIMSIGLDGYTKDEMAKMKIAVDQKR